MPDEYISREAAIREIERRERLMVGDKTISVDALKQFILNRPAADAAEVVRCKDCKHKVRTDANGIVVCSEEHGMYCQTENDFCSYGERREE